MANHKGTGHHRPTSLSLLNAALRRYFVPRGDREPARGAPMATAPTVNSPGGKP